DAGLFLRADGEQRGIVLRLREKRLRNAPEVARAHARRDILGQALPVDEPVGLRIAAHKRGGEEHPGILRLQKRRPWPDGDGGRKRLQSSAGALRPLPCPFRLKRRQASSKRFSRSPAKVPVPLMRVPKRGSLSRPPRICWTM